MMFHKVSACPSGYHRVQVWWRSSHLSGRRIDLRKMFTDRHIDGRTDGRTDAALMEWAKKPFSLYNSLRVTWLKTQNCKYHFFTKCYKIPTSTLHIVRWTLLTVMVRFEFCNGEKSDLCSFVSLTTRSPLQSCYKLNSFYRARCDALCALSGTATITSSVCLSVCDADVPWAYMLG